MLTEREKGSVEVQDLVLEKRLERVIKGKNLVLDTPEKLVLRAAKCLYIGVYQNEDFGIFLRRNIQS